MREHIINILTESFDKNKSANYAIHPRKRNNAGRKSLMEYALDCTLYRGEVILNKQSTATALLVDSQKAKKTFKQTILDLKLALRVIGLLRVFKVMKRECFIEKHHPKTAFLYLWFLGVKKEHQGKGLGSELLDLIIQKSEASNKPIYLETSMSENVRLYERFGFKIYKTWNSNEAAFTTWFMRRFPQ